MLSKHTTIHLKTRILKKKKKNPLLPETEHLFAFTFSLLFGCVFELDLGVSNWGYGGTASCCGISPGEAVVPRGVLVN